MSSRKSTLFLGISALMAGGFACMQFLDDDLGLIFGTAPHRAGEILYGNFDLEDVHSVVIRKSEEDRAEFIKRQGVWHMTSPTQDRADYTALQAILYVSRHLKVEDSIKKREITPAETGIHAPDKNGGGYRITLKDSSQKELADYQLGRRTAWHRLNEKEDNLVETFFVHPQEDTLNSHVYVCSGPEKIKNNVRNLLDRGLSRLRDHHPLLFNPKGVTKITIRSQNREIILNRPGPGPQTWTMAKPIESRTKPEKVNGLISGLTLLESTRIHDRKSITIPPPSPRGISSAA